MYLLRNNPKVGKRNINANSVFNEAKKHESPICKSEVLSASVKIKA
jgi:hypothetical protein